MGCAAGHSEVPQSWAARPGLSSRGQRGSERGGPGSSAPAQARPQGQVGLRNREVQARTGRRGWPGGGGDGAMKG